MATIKPNCPTCGPVELAARQVDLRMPSRGSGIYRFTCPRCQEQITKPADRHVADLLISGGVTCRVLTAPPEWFETKPGAPLSYDDLLDFAVALDHDDYLADLAARETTAGP